MWNYENAIMKTGYVQDGKPVPVTPKLSNSNCAQPVELQAARYAEWIKENGEFDLSFFPLKKSPLAHTNISRRVVLEQLTGMGKLKVHPRYNRNMEMSYMERLQRGAENLGYTINEYNPD